jgi:hypothetical protein
MPWWKKKQSPVERRMEQLDQRIAELQAQLRARPKPEPLPPVEEPAASQPNGQETEPDAPASPPKAQSRPRFRTTVTPKSATPVHGIEPHEVDFFARKDRGVNFDLEASDATGGKGASDHKSPGPPQSPGLFDGLAGLFSKPKPPPAQDRLASYLTTGSFQRIKPLKYEKRVARNRLIAVVLIVLAIAFLLARCLMR